MKRRAWALGLSLVVGLDGGLAAGAAADPRPALLRRAAGDTPLSKDLQELCDHVGGRPTGSPSCSRAVAWAQERFRAIGLPKVSTESFTVPILWLGGTSEVRVLLPEAFQVRGAAAPMSPSMAAPLEARVVDGGQGTACVVIATSNAPVTKTSGTQKWPARE